MAEVEIRAAQSAAELEIVRGLMREYGAYLAASPGGAANICLEGYEDELAGLPGPYRAPGVLLVASVRGEPAGCVALKEMRRGELAFEVKRLWVRPEHRGLKLGRRLMEEAIAWARSGGAQAVYLDTVRAAMPEAIRLYAALGFTEVERYNDNPVADVVFFRLAVKARD